MIVARSFLVATPLLVLGLASGCDRRACISQSQGVPGIADYGRLTESRPVPGNLISNGGFENGLIPWFSTSENPTVLSTAVAHSGRNSLHAILEGKVGGRGQNKWGGFYEVGKVPFPKHLSFWYRVDRWQAANVPQYLMVMVALSNDITKYNYQIRYIFGGLEKSPYNNNGNVHFVVKRSKLPEPGQWEYLSLDLEQDFLTEWRRIPVEFDTLRFAVLVRYDAIKQALSSPVQADVYFDDVYVGWEPSPDDRVASAKAEPGLRRADGGSLDRTD